MPAIPSLLTKNKSVAIEYFWAILDFVTIADYTFHIKKTL